MVSMNAIPSINGKYTIFETYQQFTLGVTYDPPPPRPPQPPISILGQLNFKKIKKNRYCSFLSFPQYIVPDAESSLDTSLLKYTDPNLCFSTFSFQKVRIMFLRQTI